MKELVSFCLTCVWLSLFAYWLWSARNVKRVSRAEPLPVQLAVYWAPLVFAFFLLGPGEWFEGSILHERFVPKALWIKWFGVLLAAAGVFLACWSRRLLGQNWSSVVQLKEGHELIESGPYRLVRHPIYTGLLLAFMGTALKVGDWRGIIAVAIVLASLWRKLRLEERWLCDQFGPGYSAYMQRTKALVPGVI